MSALVVDMCLYYYFVEETTYYATWHKMMMPIFIF